MYVIDDLDDAEDTSDPFYENLENSNGKVIIFIARGVGILVAFAALMFLGNYHMSLVLYLFFLQWISYFSTYTKYKLARPWYCHFLYFRTSVDTCVSSSNIGYVYFQVGGSDHHLLLLCGHPLLAQVREDSDEKLSQFTLQGLSLILFSWNHYYSTSISVHNFPIFISKTN